MRVRAGNGNGWSGWKNSNPTAPWTTERVVSTPIDDDSREKLEKLNNWMRNNWGGNWGQRAPDPTPATYMSASNVAKSSATLTLHHYGGAWSYKEASGGCVNKTSGTATVNLAGLIAGSYYSYTAYPGSGCSRDSMAFANFKTTGVGLLVSNITSTGATLTVTGHTGTWSYNARVDRGSGTCITPVSSPTTTATLLSGKTYQTTAYSGAGCTDANAVATIYFSTTDAFVGNLGTADSSGAVGNVFGTMNKRAAAFTTGNATNGYELKGVTLQFLNKSGSGSFGNIVVAVHGADTGNSSNPAATASITLSGSNPNGLGLYTYTCSTGCDLSQNTTYFIVVSAPNASSGNWYMMRLTKFNDETPYPADSGWSIADEGRAQLG